MSDDYKIITELKYQDMIQQMCSSLPAYFAEFYEFWHNKGRKSSTLFIAIRNVRSFLQFIQYMIPECHDMEFKDLPVFIFDKLTDKDLEKYWSQMKEVKFYKYQVRCKNMSSLSIFYKFLNKTGKCKNNPFLFFELPESSEYVIKKEKLTNDLSALLLSGILDNDKYLASTDHGQDILPIPYHVLVKRERLVLRNYAICTMLLETDLRVSEIVGLNINDLNLESGYLTVPGKNPGSFVRIALTAPAIRALKTYIDGIPIPEHYLDQYLFQDSKIYQWCQEHLQNPNAQDKIRTAFPDHEECFYKDVMSFISILRRQGRQGLKPSPKEKALFLSSRGTRITVRMLEYMVKEMVQTYLPEFEDKDIFSPEKFRK